MAEFYDLKEISNKYAKKQPMVVDELTEEAPILASVKWEQASHGLWNIAEKVTDITGAQFTNLNSPLPAMNVSSDLTRTDLANLGGEMEVAKATADQMGGAAAYFAKRQPKILKQAGSDTERKLYYDNWLAKAILDGHAVSAGGTGSVYSMVAVRFEAGANGGLFDPTNFNSGSLLEYMPINNGSLYHLRTQANVLGYGVAMTGRFGWQNISERSVGAIVNIKTGSLPTADQIDNMLADIRARPENTILCMHEKCRILALNPFKEKALQMGVMEKNFSRSIAAWNGIEVVTSYNIQDGTETAVTLP